MAQRPADSGGRVTLEYDEKSRRSKYPSKGTYQRFLEKQLRKELNGSILNGHGIPVGTFRLFEDLGLLKNVDLQSSKDRAAIVWSLRECAPIFKGERLDRLEMMFTWLLSKVLADKSLALDWALHCGCDEDQPFYIMVAWLAQDVLRQWNKLSPKQRSFFEDATESLIVAGHSSKFTVYELVGVFDCIRGPFLFADTAARGGHPAVAVSLLKKTPIDVLVSRWTCEDRGKMSFLLLYEPLWCRADEQLLRSFIEMLARAICQSACDPSEMVLEFMNKTFVPDICKLDFLLSFFSAIRCKERDFGREGSEKSWCLSFPMRRKPDKNIGDLSMRAKLLTVERTLLDRLLDNGENKTINELGASRELQELMEALFLISWGDSLYEWAMDLTVARSTLAKKLLEKLVAPHIANVVQKAADPDGCEYENDAVQPDNDDVTLQRLIDGREDWTLSQPGCRYFYDGRKGKQRRLQDVGKLVLMFLKLDLALGGSTACKFMRALEWDSDCLATCFNTIFPRSSAMRIAICSEVRHNLFDESVPLGELIRLCDYIAFFDPTVQRFLRCDAIAQSWSSSAIIALLEALVKLLSVHGSPRDRRAEDSMVDMTHMCSSNSLTCEFMGRVSVEVVRRDPTDFLPRSRLRGGGGFLVSNLQECARRLHIVSEVIDMKIRCRRIGKMNALDVMGGLVDSALKTEPVLWEANFASLDTNLFFLEYMGKEDFDLAYEAFDWELSEASPTSQLVELLECVKRIYKEPLVNLNLNSISDSKDLDIEAYICQNAKRLSKPVVWCGIPFTPKDWEDIIEIAGATTAGIQEKLGMPMPPHHTQMITLLMFAVRACGVGLATSLPKTMLARVGTGEGKSWIIGMLAAFVARRGARMKNGLRAHVIIDSPTLKARDFNNLLKFFEKLGIKASKEEEDLLKPECKVVYCTGAEIWSRCRQCQESGEIGKFEDGLRNAILIVDEVDGLIIDGDPNVQYQYRDEAMSFMADRWLREKEHGLEPEVQPDPDKNMSIDELYIVLDKVNEAYEQARQAQSGVDFEWRGDNMYMIDTSTGRLLEGWWDLWYEIRHWIDSEWSYGVTYKCTKSILCKSYCFTAYSAIFGLTGSLGQGAELQYLAKHYDAISFRVPYFLETCRAEHGGAQGKPVVTLLNDGDIMQPDEETQTRKAIELACQKSLEVPVIMIVKEQAQVERVALELCWALSVDYDEGPGGDRIIKLLETPGQPEQFVKLVHLATQPWINDDEEKYWRITVTTAEGGRGHDYVVADPSVDDNGGLCLILMWVSWSHREWIQFIGRTARQDHEGQYAVYLNEQAEDIAALKAEGVVLGSDRKAIGAILNAGNSKMSKKFQDVGSEIARGKLMHDFSTRYWEAFYSTASTSQQQEDVWRRLCREYLDGKATVDSLRQEFEGLFSVKMIGRDTNADPSDSTADVSFRRTGLAPLDLNHLQDAMPVRATPPNFRHPQKKTVTTIAEPSPIDDEDFYRDTGITFVGSEYPKGEDPLYEPTAEDIMNKDATWELVDGRKQLAL